MTEGNWGEFVLGLGIGAVVSAVFFAGLAIGMRVALRATATTAILLLSAGLRIALLLAVGWFVAQSVGGWGVFGYAVSFLVVRYVAITFAHPRNVPGDA